MKSSLQNAPVILRHPFTMRALLLVGFSLSVAIASLYDSNPEVVALTASNFQVWRCCVVETDQSFRRVKSSTRMNSGSSSSMPPGKLRRQSRCTRTVAHFTQVRPLQSVGARLDKGCERFKRRRQGASPNDEHPDEFCWVCRWVLWTWTRTSPWGPRMECRASLPSRSSKWGNTCASSSLSRGAAFKNCSPD